MGTTKSGRVLNTQGGRNSASHFAVVHSNEGAYTKPQNGDRIRLKSGGHGQTNINEMNKYGIRYVIKNTYPNGVRVGYVIDHTNKAKRQSMSQSWFPKSWKSADIKRAGEHVAKLKQNSHVPNGKPIFGMWKGVRVGVIKTNGRIGTIFPDSKQPKRR